jgi:hypothetical protein
VSLTQSTAESTAARGAAEIEIDSAEPVYAELWISLASLLRSYTAVHGLRGNRMALIEADRSLIVAQHGEKQLKMRRTGAVVNWMRENGVSGELEMTLHGRLRENGTNRLDDGAGEEEMDMAAEAWARELMREFEP